MNKNQQTILDYILSKNGLTPSRRILQARYPDILPEVLNQWPEYLKEKSFAEKVYYYLYPEKTICDLGNHKSFQSFNCGYAFCAPQCECAIQAKQKTMVDRYGVRHALQSPLFKEKFKNTLIERYNACTLNEAFKEKREKTNIERYGAKTPLESNEIRQKTVDSLNEKFGVKTGFELPQFKAASIEASKTRDRTKQKERYFETNPEWYDKEYFISLLKTKSRMEASKILNCSLSLIDKRIRDWNLDEFQNQPSFYEVVIESFLNQNQIKYEKNTRKIIPPKEIDFYLPEFKLAIEFNGLHWHSERFGKKNRKYHLNKTLECKALGIDLIHIFQDEWDNHSDTVKSIILNKCNKVNNRYHARKLECRLLDSVTTNEFLDQYHLQKHSIGISHNYGLFDNEELLAVMTFKPVRKSDRTYEMSRYCVKPGIQISGGASKLLKRFERDIEYKYSSILTYSDIRYFQGGVYEKLGFDKISDTQPNYWYFQNANKRHHRLNFTKQKLVKEGFDKSMSEWEIMQQNGWDRIWDCGNTKWIKYNSNG